MISIKIGIGTKVLTLDQICAKFGLKNGQNDTSHILVDIENNGNHIKAAIHDHEKFPSIELTGKTKNREFMLACIEPPNPDFPEDFTTKIYAGCPEYETETWIALTKHNKNAKSVTNEPYNPSDELTKIVYIDDDVATAKTLDAYGDDVPYDRLPEHKEDLQ